MLYDIFWQSALLISTSVMLADAAPVPDDGSSVRAGLCNMAGGFGFKCAGVEAVPDCAESVKALKWGFVKPTWMKADKPSGVPFCLSHWDSGSRIVGLRAYKQPSEGCNGNGAISRLEVRFSDGVTVPVGSKGTDCEAGSIGLNSDDEVFSDVVISNAARDTPDAQGSIRLKTSTKLTKGFFKHFWGKAQERWLNKQDNPGAEDFNMGTAGGHLVGIMGYVDHDVITAINIVPTPARMEKVVREDMEYDLDFLRKQVVNTNTIVLGSWTNQNGKPTESFSASMQVTGTKVTQGSWAQTWSSIGGAIHGVLQGEVYLRIPVWDAVEAKDGVAAHWEYTKKTTESKDTKDVITDTVTLARTGTVDRGQTVTCTAISGDVELVRVPFKSKTTIYYKGISQPYTYREPGWLDGKMTLLQDKVVCTSRAATAADLKTPGIVVL